MPFIAFLGCDGSGKSAVIAAVTAELESTGHDVTRGHWRPAPFASERQPGASAEDPHGLPPRGFISSLLKLCWLWLNWWLGWFSSLRYASKHGFLLFDRYHADLLVDPLRYRYGGPIWLARLASRTMPQPDRVVFLDASPEVLLARKQEVSAQALEKLRKSYLSLAATSSRIAIVDAAEPLPSVIRQALSHIAKCH